MTAAEKRARHNEIVMRAYHTPEGKRKAKARAERWYANGGKEMLQRLQRHRLYGLTHDAYLAMLESQDGLCAMGCGRAAVCVDHDHATGKVRGLLCRGCNVGLGFYEKLHNHAAEYLRRSKENGR